MVAKILDSRMADNKSAKRKRALSDDDPRKISATIAVVAPKKLKDTSPKKSEQIPKIEEFQRNITPCQLL